MRFFASGFFHVSFPPAPEYPIRTISNLFENLRRYSQVKVHHQCQRHRCQICCRYQQHWWQIFHRSTAPAANFATSFASVVDTGGKFATNINDSGGKFAPQCHQNWWQFAAGITDTGDKFATCVNDAGGK
jgi:hypothetical protein